MKTSRSSLECEQLILFAGDQVDWNMPVIKIIPQQFQYFPTACIRKFYIQSDSNRRKTVNKIKHLDVIGCNNSLESLLVCTLDDDLPKTQVVFNNKDHFILCLDIVAVIS